MTALGAIAGRAALLGVAAALPSCEQRTQQAPDLAAAEALLNTIDDAFNRAAVEDYSALFAAVPRPGQRSLLMRNLLGRHRGRLAQSSSVIDFWQIGDQGVIWANSSLATTDQSDVGTGPEVAAHSVLVFRDEGAGPKVVLYEEIAPNSPKHHPVHGIYHCPPCNFSIGAETLADWVIVPSPKEVSGCIEMVSFFLPGEDIQLTLSIHHNDDHAPAADRLKHLLMRCREDLGEWTDEPTVEAWTPPRYAGNKVNGMEGARCSMDLSDGQRQSLHLLTQQNGAQGSSHNEICYLLTVRGSAKNHSAFMADIDTWLASFELIDPDRASDMVGRQAAHMHSGRGVLNEDGSYRNEQHGLSFQGPNDWGASLRADRCLFGASYQCPLGTGELTVTAYEGMPGDLDDRESAAFEKVRSKLVDELGLEIVSDKEWWSVAGYPTLRRYLDVEAVDPKNDSVRRLAKLMLFTDLLVVVDGVVKSEEAEKCFHDLAKSVTR